MAAPVSHLASNPAWQDWMETLLGGMSRQRYAATFPLDRFYCLLDELPLHLIPQPAQKLLRLPSDQKRRWFLNPECSVHAAGDLPEELALQPELVSRFAQEGTVAWVRNPVAGTLLPFWLGPPLLEVMKTLRPHQELPSSVPDRLRRLLVAADILIPGDGAEGRGLQWNQRMARLGSHFRQKAYVPIADLIHPFQVAALRRYYRHLIRTSAISLGDGQSPRRYAAYKEPVARFFHQQIRATLSAVAGQQLQPSYVYLASYLSGAELRKHTDREQCEFSVTLCLDFCPEPALESPWPIRLDTAAGAVAVHQALGDGLAYRGTKVPHYRDVLGEGQTSTSIFFHYVAEDFAGSLD
jgi:hypothetical protein